MSDKKPEAKKTLTEETPEEEQQTIGNDYYAEAEKIRTTRGTTIIVNINTGQAPLPPYKP